VFVKVIKKILVPHVRDSQITFHHTQGTLYLSKLQTLGFLRATSGSIYKVGKQVSLLPCKKPYINAMPRRGALSRLHCNMYLILENPNKSIPRIIGQGGAHVRMIAEATHSKIRVRGRGSGHRETDGREASVPLMISISAAGTEAGNFATAVSSVIQLLERLSDIRSNSRGLYKFSPMLETTRKVLLEHGFEGMKDVHLPVIDPPGVSKGFPYVPGPVATNAPTVPYPMFIDASALVATSAV